jgi:hypothetical protein
VCERECVRERVCVCQHTASQSSLCSTHAYIQTHTHQQEDLNTISLFLACTEDQDTSAQVLHLALRISHSNSDIASAWCKEWPSILLNQVRCGSSECRILALTLLELLLVEGPTEIEKDFDQSGGYVLLFGFLEDVVGDAEQEDCYAVLLDLLLGHRCVRVHVCVIVCVQRCRGGRLLRSASRFASDT